MSGIGGVRTSCPELGANPCTGTRIIPSPILVEKVTFQLRPLTNLTNLCLVLGVKEVSNTQCLQCWTQISQHGSIKNSKFLNIGVWST